jgi:hypothetical protein
MLIYPIISFATAYCNGRSLLAAEADETQITEISTAERFTQSRHNLEAPKLK